MLDLTPQQNALAKKLIKAGPRGVLLADCHEMTVDALLRRGLVRLDNRRVILTAPTKKVRTGAAVRTVLDLEAVQA